MISQKTKLLPFFKHPSGKGVNPGSQEEYWKNKINHALFLTFRAPNKGVTFIYRCFDSQAWLMEGRRVGVFKEKNFIVLNDLLGHFKQF